jgi:hypothetical protein
VGFKENTIISICCSQPYPIWDSLIKKIEFIARPLKVTAIWGVTPGSIPFESCFGIHLIAWGAIGSVVVFCLSEVPLWVFAVSAFLPVSRPGFCWGFEGGFFAPFGSMRTNFLPKKTNTELVKWVTEPRKNGNWDGPKTCKYIGNRL